jgi:hypothetical protein
VKLRFNVNTFSLSLFGILKLDVRVIDSDRQIARQLLTHLEGRRVLTESPRRSLEDLPGVVRSVEKIRSRLDELLEKGAAGDELAAYLRWMRGASLAFLDQAGHDGARLRQDQVEFALRLGEYQARMGEQLALLAIAYEIEFEDSLARIMPPESTEWLPKMISVER